jgi:hypothetical protein
MPHGNDDPEVDAIIAYVRASGKSLQVFPFAEFFYVNIIRRTCECLAQVSLSGEAGQGHTAVHFVHRHPMLAGS